MKKFTNNETDYDEHVIETMEFSVTFMFLLMILGVGALFLIPGEEQWTKAGLCTMGVSAILLLIVYIRYKIKIKKN